MANSFNELSGLGDWGVYAALAAWWRCQDNAASTAVLDSSPNGYDGTLNGGDYTEDLQTTGPVDWQPSALQFDGAADYVSVAGIPNPFAATPWTVTSRLRFDGNPASGLYGIVSNYSGSTVAQSHRTVSIEDSAYHDLALTYDGANLSCFVDGTQIGSPTAVAASNGVLIRYDSALNRISTYTSSSAGTFEVANSPHAGAHFFVGPINDVRVYTDGLSASENAELIAGPEPVYVGGFTRSFSVDKTTATWNVSNSNWGLDASLGVAADANGVLTAEVRIKRDGVIVATSAGFSGSLIVPAGDDFALEMRVSNDGGYDDGQGTDGWVEVAQYGIAAGLELHFRLAETEGTVARNEVRGDDLLDGIGDFDAGTTPHTYGPVPTGFTHYGSILDTPAVQYREQDGDIQRWHFENTIGSTQRIGIYVANALTVGQKYVSEIRWRRTAGSGSVSLEHTTSSNIVSNVNAVALGEWQVTKTGFTAGASQSYTSLYSTVLGATAEIEIDYIRIYPENYGTSVRDASLLTTPAPVSPDRRGFTLNGTSDVINCGNLALPDAGQTITALVKTTASSGYILASRNDTVGGLSAYITGGALFALIGTVVQSTGTTAINDGEWHHIAVVYRAAAGRIDYYVDSVLVASDTSLTGTWSTTAPTTIGARTSGGSYAYYLAGSLDDVLLYSRELQASEIEQIYRTTIAGMNPIRIIPSILPKSMINILELLR